MPDAGDAPLSAKAVETIDQLWTDLHVFRDRDFARMTLICLTVDLGCDMDAARAVAERELAAGRVRYTVDQHHRVLTCDRERRPAAPPDAPTTWPR